MLGDEKGRMGSIGAAQVHNMAYHNFIKRKRKSFSNIKQSITPAPLWSGTWSSSTKTSYVACSFAVVPRSAYTRDQSPG